MYNKKILIIVGVVGVVLVSLLVILMLLNQQGTQGGNSFDQNVIPTLSQTTGTNEGLTPPTDGDVPINREAFKEIVTDYRTTRPDFFLKVYVPFQNNDFAVTSMFKESGGKAYFEFVVKSKSGSVVAARESFIQWAENLGLTSDQISTLKVTYE